MSKASAARRLAAAAAYGGGGLGVLGGGLYALVKLQARRTRQVIGPIGLKPPRADGTYGSGGVGEPISLLLLGDSAAAGYGMTDRLDTPGAMLGEGLAAITGRPVRVTSRAFVGARSANLEGQIDAGLRAHPDVAVIVIGANDVTHGLRPSDAVRDLDRAVRRLRAAGCEVVVGTCPDLGRIGPVAWPLRQVAREWSRRMAAAQTITTVEAGGRSVSLAELLGRQFSAAPSELFGDDQFHPSLAGYASMVATLLPSVAAALGEWDADDDLDLAPGDEVLPVSFAAVEAVEVAGTEVSPAQVGGNERGPRGGWAQLRHRRRAPLPARPTHQQAGADPR